MKNLSQLGYRLSQQWQFFMQLGISQWDVE